VREYLFVERRWLSCCQTEFPFSREFFMLPCGATTDENDFSFSSSYSAFL